jgi:hypothetical protein
MPPPSKNASLKSVFKNTRLMIWVALVLALTGSLWWTGNLIEKSLKRVLATRQEIVVVQKTLETFADLKTQKLKAEAYKDKLNLLFPTRTQLLQVLAFLEDRAVFYRFQPFFSFGEETPLTPQEPAYIGFSLSLTGGLPEFVSYLAETEKAPTLISFSNLEILNKSKAAYQLNTAGKIYLQSYATSIP